MVALVLLVGAAPASGKPPQPTSPAPRETVLVERDGFRWSDAAIGAVAGVGLVFLVAGVAILIDTRAGRRRHVKGEL